jgi:hypothetical protein
MTSRLTKRFFADAIGLRQQADRLGVAIADGLAETLSDARHQLEGQWIAGSKARRRISGSHSSLLRPRYGAGSCLRPA